MNNTFDFGRFSLLIRRQWMNFGKIYLLSIGIIAGLFICYYGFYLSQAVENPDEFTIQDMLDFRLALFSIVGIVFVTIVSSAYFSNLGDKSKAIFELLIPASRLEKFLAAVFYSFVLSIGTYLLLFYAVDIAFVSYEREYFSNYLLEAGAENKNIAINYFFNHSLSKAFYYAWTYPVLLSSIFLLGSVYFNKYQYIKTAICLLVYSIVYVFLMVKIMRWVTFGTIEVERNGYISSPNSMLQLMCGIGLLVTIVFWVIGYYRLKEKEV